MSIEFDFRLWKCSIGETQVYVGLQSVFRMYNATSHRDVLCYARILLELDILSTFHMKFTFVVRMMG